MSLAALMVYFDASPNARARVRLAVDLAGRFQTALIGIAAPPYLPAVAAGVPDALAGIKRKFRDDAAAVKNVEWRGGPVWAGVLVPQVARAADLVIVGPAPNPHALSYSHHPGAIILRAGRPVPFVPEGVEGLE